MLTKSHSDIVLQITCGKKRIGEERKVVIQDGDPKGEHVLIIDDMVKTGGTLASCATVRQGTA